MPLTPVRNKGVKGAWPGPSRLRYTACMKRALPLLLGLTAVGCWPRSPGPVASSDAAAPVAVLRVPVDGGDAVTWTATIRAGSSHDPVGQAGLSWLVAEVLADQLAATGDVELHVGAELVDLALTCPGASSAACGDALATTLAHPRFDDASLARARAAAHHQLAVATSDPRVLTDAAAAALVFAGHPYDHLAVGRAGVLDSLGPGDLQRLHGDRYLRPSVVIGAVGPVADADVTAVQAALEALPPRLYRDVTPRGLPRPPARDVTLRASVSLDQPANALVTAVDLPPAHPDRVAVDAGLALLADALDEVADARLWPDPAVLQPAIILDLAPGASPEDARQAIADAIAAGPDPAVLAAWQAAHAWPPADPVARVQAQAAARLLGASPPDARRAAAAALDADTVATALSRWLHPEDLRTITVLGTPTPSGHDGVEGSGDASVDAVDAEPAPAAHAPGATTQPPALPAEELLR